MPIVYFTGRVLPATNIISIDNIHKPRLHMKERDLVMEATIKIKDSAISVACEMNRFADGDLDHAHKFCFDMARACIDLAAFAGGYGVVVVFETFIDPNGHILRLHYANPVLQKECTVIKMNTEVEEERARFYAVLSLVMTDFQLLMALNDLIQANSLPHQGPTNCGRVLDSLRKLVAPGIDPKPGWDTLRSIVRVDKQYTACVSNISTFTRHGGGHYVSGQETGEIARRTWVVMNRYLEYRIRGSQELPAVGFPFLMG